MRVISKDYTINVSYENSFLCVIEDADEKSFHVAVRTPSLQNYMPLATYDTKEKAVKVFKMMADEAASSTDIDSIFVLP